MRRETAPPPGCTPRYAPPRSPPPHLPDRSLLFLLRVNVAILLFPRFACNLESRTHLGRASEDVVAGAGASAAEEPPAKGEACAYCPAFALHEAGDQADITLGLGGFFSGDVEMRLLTEKALLDQL